MKTRADAFRRILEVFDRLEIRYFVGGSVASAAYGIPRATMDADLVADVRLEQTEELAAELKADFYADADMMKDALQRGRSFNVIHYESSFKFDIFPLLGDDYSLTQFRRRRFENTTSFGDEPIECAIATAEDTILNKLRWYRAGGEISEQQWNDLRGILQVRGAQLDFEYLHAWAPRLGVEDLLERLLGEREKQSGPAY
jgi:hypothetical protein